MQVVIQHFEGCSSRRLAEERLRTALARIGRPDISPSSQLVEDRPDAELSGFCGSPTILIDGCDPFAEAFPGVAAMACRIYHTPDGVQGAPTVEQLVEVIGGKMGSMSVVVDELAQALKEVNPSLDSGERRLVRALYSALAEGAPVRVDELARRTSNDPGWIRRTLDGWSGVFRDDEDCIVGFGGLGLAVTPHVLEVNDQRLYTWCAFDPLFIAPLLGRSARVRSICPVTNRLITLTVCADGVEDVEPPEVVLSFLRPCESCRDDIVERFCHFIHFFASPEAAESWTADHPGTFVLTLDEAVELGRRTFRRLDEVTGVS